MITLALALSLCSFYAHWSFSLINWKRFYYHLQDAAWTHSLVCEHLPLVFPPINKAIIESQPQPLVTVFDHSLSPSSLGYASQAFSSHMAHMLKKKILLFIFETMVTTAGGKPTTHLSRQANFSITSLALGLGQLLLLCFCF